MSAANRLGLENLEQREVPAANPVSLAGGVLVVEGHLRADNVGSVSQATDANGVTTTTVNLNGKSFAFTDAVSRIVYLGGNKGDEFANNTNLSALINGGSGKNILTGGTGDDTILAGNGENYIVDPNGNNTIVVGNGKNNIFGGVGTDNISVGHGKNVVYDLLGVNTITVREQHGAVNRLFTNALSTVNGADENDKVVTFFGQGRELGSGKLLLENGVLYFAGNNNGNSFVFDKVGDQLVVSYNLGNGGGFFVQSFNFKEVKILAGFGGSGNDTFINNTKIDMVAYGSSGDDTIVGGMSFNLLKGSGGNDVVVGRGYYNDVSGNSGNNVLTGNQGKHVKNLFRTDSPGDTLQGVNPGDVFVGNNPNKPANARR